jgi:hypothetical protein
VIIRRFAQTPCFFLLFFGTSNEIVSCSKEVRRELILLLLFNAALSHEDNPPSFCHFAGICDTHSNKETNFLPCVCVASCSSPLRALLALNIMEVYIQRTRPEEEDDLPLRCVLCRLPHAPGWRCSVITKRRRLAHLPH